MYFKRTEVKNFRNLASASNTFSPSLNLISGSNGSGKSSFLEAIHFISTGTSFRTKRLSNLISNNQDCFTLFAEAKDTVSHNIGIQRCSKTQNITRLDGRDIQRRSELVHLFPLQTISPESINLITDGSETRRNYLDWSLFHVEQSFYFHNSHYNRALKQRNSLLKTLKQNSLQQWNLLLVEHGNPIDTYRYRILNELKPYVESYLSELLPGVEIDISYRSGWSKDFSLLDALSAAEQTDRKLKHTTVGPHRGDISLRYNGVRISETLSRGEQKLVVIALKLAQIMHLHRDSNKQPIILIDDLAAELDVDHREILLDTIQSLNTQVFITTPDIDLINISNWKDKKMFHVEHGEVKEVV